MLKTNNDIDTMGPWFHNLHLPDGSQTAPDHFLGDFPKHKWDSFKDSIPQDLSGWTALDIGCNAGFYTFQLATRGADVVGIDHDSHYLNQARWAAEKMGMKDKVQFQQKQIYDLSREDTRFDLVWFMGVFYHLRYPLLGLDIASRKTKKMLVFQTMTTLNASVSETPYDISLTDRPLMSHPSWPSMAFIEHCLQGDPTNWWAANDACVEAMLRSTGMEVISKPAHEIYVCRPNPNHSPNQKLLRREYQSAIGLP